MNTNDSNAPCGRPSISPSATSSTARSAGREAVDRRPPLPRSQPSPAPRSPICSTSRCITSAGAPSTRTLGHSLLFIAIVLLFTWIIAERRGRRPLAVAFAVGLLSHPIADAVWPLCFADFHELSFLLWPLAPAPDYEPVKQITTLGAVSITTRWIEYGLLAAAIGQWVRDETPGYPGGRNAHTRG
ncbi:metal-dependent hydrolase [Haloferacaceae archaeon DSL9]